MPYRRLLDDGELPADLLASYPADERTMVPSRTQPMEWLFMFMLWLACMSIIIGTALISPFVVGVW